MARKGKRGGVIWNTDPDTGNPRGSDVNEWDGVSRTNKRKQKRALIAERRNILVAYTNLDTEVRSRALSQVRRELETRLGEDQPLNDALITQLERLSQMKRGGAKQREIKHLSAHLDETAWEALLLIQEAAAT